jgi:hypothetical protein
MPLAASLFPRFATVGRIFRREVVSNACLKLIRAFEIGGGTVQTKFAFLSKFGIKFIEVASAGLASALCAFCLGQLGEPRRAPPAPIVQVLPASEDAIRMARDDHALLAALVRKETEHQKREEVPALAGAAAKPAKPAPGAQARRNQKPEPTASVETPPRAAEPLPLQPPTAASPSAARPAARSAPPPLERDEFAVSASSPSGEEEHPLLARLGQIPSWFLPGNDRVFGEVPRPPMPVGEFFPSAM